MTAVTSNSANRGSLDQLRQKVENKEHRRNASHIIAAEVGAIMLGVLFSPMAAIVEKTLSAIGASSLIAGPDKQTPEQDYVQGPISISYSSRIGMIGIWRE